eukprot:gene2270-2608_t
MAGLGESCSHIGPILFKVEAAVRLGYTTAACTDQPCAWNNDFVKSVEGESLKNIQFFKKKELKKVHAHQFTDASPEEKSSLLDHLSAMEPKEQPLSLSLFGERSSTFHFRRDLPPEPRLPKPLRDWYTSDGTQLEVIWGQEHEEVALTEYKVKLEAYHTNVKLAKTGLQLDSRYHFLGASADAIEPHDDARPMVGGDNPSCKYEWIHFDCGKPKLKKPPRGAWYCKDCKKAKKIPGK